MKNAASKSVPKRSRIFPLKAEKKGENRNRGYLFLISAPSGAGKTTLCKAVLERFQDMLYSISYTTREPRTGERNGVDYYFIGKDDFIKGIEGEKWAEWAEVHGNFYGTSAEFLDQCIAAGKDILLDIDIQGTIQIMKRYPETVTFFIMPPSLDVLKKRLKMRGTESDDAISNRIVTAKKEMEQKDLYRHVIINDQLSAAISELVSIIEKYRYNPP